MLSVNIICIGKIKERYWTDAIAEYKKTPRRVFVNSISLSLTRKRPLIIRTSRKSARF